MKNMRGRTIRRRGDVVRIRPCGSEVSLQTGWEYRPGAITGEAVALTPATARRAAQALLDAADVAEAKQ